MTARGEWAGPPGQARSGVEAGSLGRGDVKDVKEEGHGHLAGLRSVRTPSAWVTPPTRPPIRLRVLGWSPLTELTGVTRWWVRSRKRPSPGAG